METRTALLAEAADGLALAVVASSNAPMLLLDDELKVIAASDSFVDAFLVEPVGRERPGLAELGDGEWAAPQLGFLLRATAAGSAQVDAYEMDNVRAGRRDRRLIVNARKLDYFDHGHARLLMSVTDVTDARIDADLKDRLLREKETLLQELQHRVANSLQIIASVLMQSARRVRSGKARGHIRDAGNRVMSIAALQRQLSASRIGEVAISAYFTELCASIGASMIGRDDRIALNVDADGSMVEAQDSVRLGLIVTELVINALKHGFPGHRRGRIDVDYRATGTGWALTVRDTGIGLPADPADLKAGIGTSIVDALALQLGASVQIASADPGTLVSVVRV
jgi:two-component system, sensor histidine kinase PdtaS